MGVTTLPTYIPLANGKTLIELRNVPVAPSPSTARLYDIESILNGWGPIADLSDILVWHTADDVDGNGHADMLATRGRRRDYVLIRNAFTVQENSQPLSANQANKYPVSWANDSELFDVNGDGCKDNIRYMSSDQVVVIYGDSAEPFSRASIAGAKPQIPFHTVGILYCGYLSGKLCLLRKTSIDNTGKPDTTLWELDTLVQEDIQQKRDTVRCHNVLTWVQNVNLSVGTMKVICDSVWHFFDVGVSTAARVRLSGIDTHEPHSTFKTADGRLLKREQMYGHGREKAYDPVRVYGDRPFLAYWARGVQDDSYSPHFVDLLRIRDQMTLRSQLLGTMVLLPPYVDQGAINNAYLIPDQDNDGFEDVVVCYRSSTDTRTVTNVTDIFYQVPLNEDLSGRARLKTHHGSSRWRWVVHRNPTRHVESP